jgi:hypothetical protein
MNKDFWNIEINKKMLVKRLVPLNKNFPQMATTATFRPIIIAGNT